MRRHTGWLGLSVVCWIGCGSSDSKAPDLAQVSQEVQFESVDLLGPHLYLASIRNRITRTDGSTERSDEAVEIRWQDWDTFTFRRVVDAELQSAVVTVDGRPWTLRSKNRWDRRDDAEPYRLDLRQSWNAWDQALEPFGERIVLTTEGTELFEGRIVRRYKVSLAPEPDADARPRAKGKRRRKKRHKAVKSVTLLSLDGRVWVDEGTAVRLQAEVTGELEQRGRRRTVELQLTRSGIGQPQEIEPPVTQRKRDRANPAPTNAPPSNPEAPVSSAPAASTESQPTSP